MIADHHGHSDQHDLRPHDHQHVDGHGDVDPRIAQAFMSASRREILGSRGRSKSQPLVTIPRNECGQRVYDCGQKPPVAPSRSPKRLSGRGSLLPRTSENSSLPLCVSPSYVSWMTPKRGRGWLENSSPLEMAVEESPLGPLLRRP